MTSRLRSALTMVVLLLMLAAGAVWGWTAVTAPFPEPTDPPLCTDRTVAKGEKVYPDQVVVSVFNAGTRSGLADRTQQLLVDLGFVAGATDNAPREARVDTAEIWTSDKSSPAVRLVRSYFGGKQTKVKRVAGAQLGPGVVVLVGDSFTDLAKGRDGVKAKTTTVICSPPGSH